MSNDELYDELFDNYIERKQRCTAVQLSYYNMWKVAQWLTSQGLGVQLITGGVCTLEVRKGEDVLFVADVGQHDAIQWDGWSELRLVPGEEFRPAWEKEA